MGLSHRMIGNPGDALLPCPQRERFTYNAFIGCLDFPLYCKITDFPFSGSAIPLRRPFLIPLCPGGADDHYTAVSTE